MEKECKKCQTIKNIEDFHSHINKNGTKVCSSCCMSCRKEIAKTWNKLNKEKHAKHQAKWRSLNRELDIARSTKRLEKVEHRIKSRLRSRLRDAIKNNQKSGSAVRDLGCSIAEFKLYIESKFQPGMGWDNWSVSGWHLDHIEPLDKFDLTDPEQLKKACHYTNLQPLWAKDNLTKSNN